jgi:type II secretory pathway component PulF
MAVFAYQGTGDRGERRTGEIDAPSRSEALRRLAMDRIQPLSLVARADAVVSTPQPRGNPAGKTRRELHQAGAIRLSTPQVILFTDELSDFLNWNRLCS